MRRTAIIVALIGLLAVGAVASSPATPSVTSVLPRGGQRGTEVVLRFAGARLNDPQGLLCHRPGIEVLEIEKGTASRFTMRIRIADDAPLGQHPLHLRTAGGVSGLWTFRVGVLPEISETGENDDPATAPKIPFDVTVNGTVTAEDQDCFRVDVPAGRLSVEVEALRLGDGDTDLRLAIVGPDGKVLADVEDTTLGIMDPWASLPNVKAGTYVIKLRETAWGGSSRHHYRLHVGDFPRPAGALPTGVAPGKEATLRYVGEGGTFTERVQIPSDAAHPYGHFPADARGIAPTPVWLMRSDLVNFIEPVDAKASRIECKAPCAVSGVISAPGETDYWRIKLKKGQRLRLISGARALRSPLDAVMFVYKKRTLSYNDDAGGSPDPTITFSAPEDGEYLIGIRDHMRRGGANYFYRITIGVGRGGLRTTIDTPRNTTPTWINVPRGGRMACVLRVAGVDRKDGIEYQAQNLPEGTRASRATLHESSPYVPFVISADAKAPLGAALVDLEATARKAPQKRAAGYHQSIPLVRVENDRVYLRTTTDRIPVAVSEALPFRIDVEQPKVPIVRGSAFGLRVTVHRDKGFKGAVQARLLYNPPGVRGGVITIPGDKNTGVLPLSQAGGVPDEPWDVVVVGRSSVGGTVETCSEVIKLAVVSPYYIAGIGKARAAQGEEVELPVTLKMREKFAGKVKVRVPNLPRDVKVSFTEIDEKSTELTCKLVIGPKAPPGRHRNLVFQFIVPTEGGNAVQTTRGGELRIDRPRKPVKGVATKKKPPGKKRAWGTVTNPKTQPRP